MRKEETFELSHLIRREIQTPIVSALIEGFAKEIGTDKTKALAKEIICKDAFLSGKTLAQKYSGNSLQDLWKIVKDIWAKDGTMEIENLTLSEKCLKFDVTRCCYAEMYESMGCKKLGNLLSCCRDFAFIEGFNRKFKLVRTKTIMQGNDICDFCYISK